MLGWWQNIPEKIDPVAFALGPVEVHWYGLMYAFAFLTVYLLAFYRIKTEEVLYTKDIVDDFFSWAIFGVFLGGRLGYVLFYNFSYYLRNPLEIFLPFSFEGGMRFVGIYGMSYHGGLIGVLLAFALFCRKRGIGVLGFMDFFAPLIPLGYTFGRIGNFINGELYGRATQVPWAMFFPMDAKGLLRHPSQLYEAFFEGVFLFLVLWFLRRRKSFSGYLTSLYLMGYGGVRFFIEFTREPDDQIGFIFGNLTMGQVLCLVMIAAGWCVFWRQKKMLAKKTNLT